MHPNCIQAAFKWQSKDSDGIRGAFQLDSLSTEKIEIDSVGIRDALSLGTFELHSSRIEAAI